MAADRATRQHVLFELKPIPAAGALWSATHVRTVTLHSASLKRLPISVRIVAASRTGQISAQLALRSAVVTSIMAKSRNIERTSIGRALRGRHSKGSIFLHVAVKGGGCGCECSRRLPATARAIIGCAGPGALWAQSLDLGGDGWAILIARTPPHPDSPGQQKQKQEGKPT